MIPDLPSDPRYPPAALSDEALRWIVRLHSGEASRADWDNFQKWRALSDDHEAAAAEAEALWNDTSELHRDPATGLIRPGRKNGGSSRRAVLGGLAGLGAIGAGGLWATGAMRSLSADHATGVAETRLVNLPDESQVTLNARSAIDVDYSSNERRVVLIEGEAYFEVKPDRLRPFVVQVDGNSVSALGTAFDINRNLPDGHIAIAVSEHAVRVTALPQASRTDRGVIVSQDEVVMIKAGGRIGAVMKQDASAVTSWRSGLYVAEERPLEDVIAAFQSYHRGWIVIRGDNLKSLKVNAVLDLRTPDVSLNTLAGGLPIRIHRLSPLLTLILAA